MPGRGSERSRTADGFHQDPPCLRNPFEADPFARAYLARVLGADVLEAIAPELHELGVLAVELADRQLSDRANEPRLRRWDAWGRRIDAIEVSPLWREARTIAAERGLVALAYERRLGDKSRVHQFAANFLVQASLDFYSCPLAMSDGAARTLLDLASPDLIARTVPRLVSRDPATVWTSGQWMTERSGGSDVGLTETVARFVDGEWRLWGAKWFASAATSEMALTLARPEGNPPGSKGLALFYVETRDDHGRPNGIIVERLKEKLGTRKVPTAELRLDGTPAQLVRDSSDGVRAIAPMLTVTRVWNAVGAAWLSRRAIALAKDYARRRVQFGSALAEKSLHLDTLAGLEAEARGAFLLAFRAAEALGRREGPSGDASLLRALTPLVKLTTAKQAVAIVAEAIEAFGGAGYVEDTGLPTLLRDAHVLPIWEGTTNVLALDFVRALGDEATREAIAEDVERRCESARSPELEAAADAARGAARRGLAWLDRSRGDRERLEAGARRFAVTLGRALELALLVEHASHELDHGRGRTDAAAARRFARHGVEALADDDVAGATLLFEGTSE